MTVDIIIIGAGAIGRGYLPWIFTPGDYGFVFVDTNKNIIEQMKRAGQFTGYRVRNGALESRTFPVKAAYAPDEFRLSRHFKAAAVFINAGPRHAASAARIIDGIDCPVILCENDPATVDSVKAATSLKNVYFAVPDVIASNTAPRHLLDNDPLSIVTEDGVLFIDERAQGLRGDFSLISAEELIHKQWTAKLYLHNTPHCVAAYMGALCGVQYVHEALAIHEVAEIVQGSMTEMLNSLKLKWEISHEFLDWYAEKELRRFRCQLLFDPISRVAREPLRKLELDGRLIGAAQICLASGFIPHNILKGIGSALLFYNENDADSHLLFMRRALTPNAFVTHVLSLRKGEALESILRDRLSSIIEQLEKLPKIGREEPHGTSVGA